MKMNKKKIASTCLITALAITTSCGLSACKKDSSNGNEKTKLTWWAPLYAHVAQTATSFGEVELYQELGKRMNVELEFVHPSVGQEEEQFNIMLSSGDLTDLIEKDFVSYKGGPKKAIQDGIIIELDKYLKNYGKDYLEVLKKNPEWEKQVLTDNGKHYNFAMFRGDESLMCWFGPQIRSDLLKKAGLEVPETIEEWENMLIAFKNMGIEYPLSVGGLAMRDTFCGAFGVSEDFYQDNGRVKYGPYEAGYKEYISLLAKWYNEGLIDADFFAHDAKSLESKITSGQVGAYTGTAGSNMGNYLPVLKQNNMSLCGAKYPVLNKGDKPQFGQMDFAYYPMLSVAVTSKCKNIEKAVELLNYGYTEEGHMLYNFGIENVSYEMKDGYPEYTDLITKNPEGLSMTHAMSRYMASPYGGPFVQDKRYYEQFAGFDEQKEAVKLWSENTGEHRIPAISFNEKESNDKAKLTNEINSFVQENSLKFITGQTSMDEYDKFVEGIKSRGIEDLLKIYQDALDRYNSK